MKNKKNRPTFLVIFSLFFCGKLISQTNISFENYLESLLIVKKEIKYSDLAKYKNIKYDSLNKEHNLIYWIDACFKKLGIEEYLETNSLYLAKGIDIEVVLDIDSNGIVTNTKVNEKKVSKFINSKLVGTSFYKDYIGQLELNGVCISNVDEEFYKELLMFGHKFKFHFGDSNSSDCNCGSK
jgi:hypothetical protein